MKLTDREKQLIWRGLCVSEELERDRIVYYTSKDTKFNRQAKEKMINTSKNRLNEIEALKEKWWKNM